MTPDIFSGEDFPVLDENLLLRETPASDKSARRGRQRDEDAAAAAVMSPQAARRQDRRQEQREARATEGADRRRSAPGQGGRVKEKGSERPSRRFSPCRDDSRPFRHGGGSGKQGMPRHGEPAATVRRWQPVSLLLPEPDAALGDGLDRLGAALARVRPLSASHARQLPQDVVALSRLLTVERAQLHHPYWASPALTSAYLYYFLPWNVLRQARLLAALPLPDPRLWLEAGRRPVLLDMGSGPLSLPLALWLARPDWRGLPLEVLALDAASQPLELGRRLLHALAEELHAPAWEVRTLRAPLGQAARQAARCLGRPRTPSGPDAPALWLASAANVLNEMLSGGAAGRAGRRAGAGDWEAADGEDAADNGHDAREDSLFGQRLENVLDGLEEVLELADDTLPASLLVVEPGTRLGGTTVMRLRAAALERGLVPLAPCTHGADCPLERGRSGRGWCHMTFDCGGAPTWLIQLAEAAGLAKSSLSLAPLLLSPAAETVQDGLDARAEAAGSSLGRAALRVLSAPFDVPGLPGRARYACGVGGLALLGDAGELPSGALVEADIPVQPRFDRRSGALLLLPGGEAMPDDVSGRSPHPGRAASRGAGQGARIDERENVRDQRRSRDERASHFDRDTPPERRGSTPRQGGQRHGEQRHAGKRRGGPDARRAPAGHDARVSRGDRRH